MRLSTFLSILTLVVASSALAAPRAPTPRPGLPANELTPVPVAADRILRTATPRPDWRWQAFVGGLAGSITAMNANESAAEFGAMLVWKHQPDAMWDFGAALTTESWVRFDVGHRHLLANDWRFEPYWRWGISQTIENKTFFGSLVDLERVKAMLSFGFADLLKQDEAWNVEAGAGWGMKGSIVELKLGWNFDL